MAAKFGQNGIRVNAIAPGYFRTEMTRNTASDPSSALSVANHTILKRWGDVGELVGTALFLSSSAASYITAVTIPVDGGYLVGSHG